MHDKKRWAYGALEAYRVATGLSVTELGSLIGLASTPHLCQVFWWRIQHGKSRLPFKRLDRVSAVLQIPVLEVIENGDYHLHSPTIREEISAEILLTVMQEMSKAGRKTVSPRMLNALISIVSIREEPPAS